MKKLFAFIYCLMFASYSYAGLIEIDVEISDNFSGTIESLVTWSPGTNLEGFQINLKDNNGFLSAVSTVESYTNTNISKFEFSVTDVGLTPLNTNFFADVTLELFLAGNNVTSYLMQDNEPIASASELLQAFVSDGIKFDTITVSFAPTLQNAGINTPTFNYQFNVTNKVDVPEPSTLAIFVLGIIGLASRRCKKQA